MGVVLARTRARSPPPLRDPRSRPSGRRPGPGPSSRPGPAPHAGAAHARPSSPGFPPPLSAPRSPGARSPPAPPSSHPLSVPPSLSFVPGAPIRFSLQPRRGRREPPPRSYRSQPRAGAQLQQGQCLTASTQETTWTQGPSTCEKMGSCTWSIWPWMVSRVAYRSQDLSDFFPKVFLWSFA